MRTAQSIHTRADFVWQVDDKVVFSFGMPFNPEFYTITESAWENLGKPKVIQIAISAL